MKLTPADGRRIVRDLLRLMGCHETQMIWQSLNNIGADTMRPGTASRVRNRYLGSAVGLACCTGVIKFGVISHPRGGRTP
jgi:hypothetical protein